MKVRVEVINHRLLQRLNVNQFVQQLWRMWQFAQIDRQLGTTRAVTASTRMTIRTGRCPVGIIRNGLYTDTLS